MPALCLSDKVWGQAQRSGRGGLCRLTWARLQEPERAAAEVLLMQNYKQRHLSKWELTWQDDAGLFPSRAIDYHSTKKNNDPSYLLTIEMGHDIVAMISGRRHSTGHNCSFGPLSSEFRSTLMSD